MNLYKSNSPNSNTFSKNCLGNISVPKLNTLEKDLCEENLTIAEIARALKELQNDKSPGNDGLTTNFYKMFWPDIRSLLYNSFDYTFKTGSLSDDQKRGIINIISKDGKDLRYLRNW